MSGPDDQQQPAPQAPLQEGWEGTRDSLKGLFEAAPAESSTPEAAPAHPAAPMPDQLEVRELQTLENESPSVSENLEVATAEIVAAEIVPTEVAPAEVVPAGGVPAEVVTDGVLAGEEVQAEPQTATEMPTDAPKVPEAPALTHSAPFQTGELEEETYAPTLSASGPREGDVVSGYQLNRDLGRGWFTANPVGSGPSVEVYTLPDPAWAALLPHRLLPRATRAGDLYVLEPGEGLPLTLPLSAAEARTHLTELARLLFALEKQGYGVTDLDPASVQLGPQGVQLRQPPRVVRLGEAAPPSLREGFTPPEVQSGSAVQPQTGVYLLGALLYLWLTGQPLPPEGPSPVTLAGVKGSGMPQLLHMLLAPAQVRPGPADVLEQLQVYSAGLPAYAVGARTDIGLNPERPANEDSYGFVWRQLGQHGGGELLLRACVADGMGGMAAGEVASQAAVRGFLSSASATLEEQVWDANAAVLQDMAGRDGGCTISAVEVRGTQLQLGHVGDTRAYLAAGGKVQQISKDHSYVAAMVASGQMTPEEAQSSPERNKVLRSLGSLRVPQATYVYTLPEPLELSVGSRVLLVSDGVWGEVAPHVLEDVLLHEPTPQAAADRLVALSLEAGAPDNVTALVIERVK